MSSSVCDSRLDGGCSIMPMVCISPLNTSYGNLRRTIGSALCGAAAGVLGSSGTTRRSSDARVTCQEVSPLRQMGGGVGGLE